MIVIIHRGYLGFQPNAVTSDVTYSFAQPDLTQFIDDGLLVLPISHDDLNADELGNKGRILAGYKISNFVYYRYFHWTIKEGASDIIYTKLLSDKDESPPQYRKIALLNPYSRSCVLAKNEIDAAYLTALVHADATIEQINDFAQEFIIGSARPFIWTPMDIVYQQIKLSESRKSNNANQIFKVRNGRSRWLIHEESKIMTKEVIQSIKTAKKLKSSKQVSSKTK